MGMIRVTYYLEVISSWCYWAEPAWAELKERYGGRVEFDWKIALMDGSGLPVSRGQAEWFYRRSGTMAGSPWMLSSGWFEPEVSEYLVPNLVAEAAKDLGVRDDRVRLAIARAALREGKKVHGWEGCAAIAAGAVEGGALNVAELKRRAQSREVEERARATTAEFHALQVSQRPTFVAESGIGDKAVFSGIWRAGPIAAALDAMLADAAGYESWAAHFGAVPPV